jgi:ATP-dependent exoDNAse (exonuclease V) beta subunit
LRQQHILQADPEGAAAAAGEQMYGQWKSARGETLARASQPSITVQTVTSLAGAETVDQRIQVEIVPDIQAERPTGRRFGVLVHSLLAAIDLDAEFDAVRAAAAVYGRLVAATDEEIDAAVTAVAAALAHPIMRRAAAEAHSGRVRRETPVLLQQDDNTLVEGVVDLAFRQETSDFSGWAVVDFKTSRDFETNQAKYTAQVALYVEAIHKATRLPTKGTLLVV